MHVEYNFNYQLSDLGAQLYFRHDLGVSGTKISWHFHINGT